MPSVNRVLLLGRLTRDPALRRTPGGSTVADLGLALSEARRDRQGQRVEDVCFVDVLVWNRQAEACAQYLRKGSPVLVEGRLQLDRWVTREGAKRSRLRVCAERVRFISKHRRGGPVTSKPACAPRSDTGGSRVEEKPLE